MPRLSNEVRPARGDLSNPCCASREVFEDVTGRWGGLILRSLMKNGLLRFAALRASVGGISEKMLAQTLKKLERDGLVQRVSYNEIPPRVEYSVTPLGNRIALRILTICEVIEEETLAITTNQVAFDHADQRRAWQTARVLVPRE